MICYSWWFKWKLLSSAFLVCNYLKTTVYTCNVFFAEMKVKLSFILMMHLLLLVFFNSRKCIWRTKNRCLIPISDILAFPWKIFAGWRCCVIRELKQPWWWPVFNLEISQSGSYVPQGILNDKITHVASQWWNTEKSQQKPLILQCMINWNF